jgi:hypothetical protein
MPKISQATNNGDQLQLSRYCYIFFFIQGHGEQGNYTTKNSFIDTKHISLSFMQISGCLRVLKCNKQNVWGTLDHLVIGWLEVRA